MPHRMELKTSLRIAAGTAFGKSSLGAWIVQRLENHASLKGTVIKSFLFEMLKVCYKERKTINLKRTKSLEKAWLRWKLKQNGFIGANILGMRTWSGQVTHVPIPLHSDKAKFWLQCCLLGYWFTAIWNQYYRRLFRYTPKNSYFASFDFLIVHHSTRSSANRTNMLSWSLRTSLPVCLFKNFLF